MKQSTNETKASRDAIRAPQVSPKTQQNIQASINPLIGSHGATTVLLEPEKLSRAQLQAPGGLSPDLLPAAVATVWWLTENKRRNAVLDVV